jgi:hypothetical protein
MLAISFIPFEIVEVTSFTVGPFPVNNFYGDWPFPTVFLRRREIFIFGKELID